MEEINCLLGQKENREERLIPHIEPLWHVPQTEIDALKTRGKTSGFVLLFVGTYDECNKEWTKLDRLFNKRVDSEAYTG